MTEQSAAEILNDLIHVNNERISRYEQLIAALDPADKELRYLFARIVGDSHVNKITLATELQAMGEYIDFSPLRRGKVYQVAYENMVRLSSGGRAQMLDDTNTCETAVLKGYEYSIQAEDVAAYLRDLLTEHQLRIRQSADEIRLLRDQIA
jgi:uncharacterized protein (TIGR02284 family)